MQDSIGGQWSALYFIYTHNFTCEYLSVGMRKKWEWMGKNWMYLILLYDGLNCFRPG